MDRSALLLLVPLLAGCNVSAKNPASGDDNVSIQADNSGHVAFNLPIAQGQVKLPANFMHEGDVDIDGVKLMPGSAMSGFSMDAGDKKATVNIAFTASASPDQVRAYYLDQFKKQGVEAALAGDAISGRSRDGDAFMIEVTPAPNGSQGKIVIHDAD